MAPSVSGRRFGKSAACRLLLVAVALAALSDRAAAQAYWDDSDTTSDDVIDGGSGTWNNDPANTNWTSDDGSVNSAWVPDNLAIFRTTGGTVTVGATIAVAALQFEVGGYIVTGGQLVIATGGAFVTANGSTATVNSLVSGTDINFIGDGNVIIGGANTYTGTTVIDSGTMTAAASGALGAAGNTLQIADGTLNLGGITHTQAIVLLNDGAGSITNGTLSATTGFVQNGGTFSATASSVAYQQDGGTMSGTANVTGYAQSAGTMSGTANVTIYTLTGGTISGTVTASGGYDLQAGTVSGTLGGAGSLTKSTAGIVTLSGANSYAGGTTVEQGTLQLTGAGTLGSTSATTTVNAGQLNLGTTTQQQATVVLDGGSIINGTLNATTAFNLKAGTVSASLGGAGALTKSEAGTVTLSGANSYAGGTTVDEGTLQLAGAGTLGAVGGTTIVNAGQLNLGTTTQTQANVALEGGSIVNGTLNATAGFLHNSGTFSGTTTTPIYAQAGGTMSGTANATDYGQSGGTLSGAANVTNYSMTGGTASGTVTATTAFGLEAGTVTGTLAGAGALTKSGAGIVTLSGANSYGGGTTVDEGTLQLTGAGTLGSVAATTTVNSGELNLGATTQQQANVILQDGSITNGTLNATTAFLQNGGTFSGTTTTPIYAQVGGTMSGTANGDVYAQSAGVLSGAANVNTYSMAGGTASGTVTAATTFDMQAGAVTGTLTGAGALTKSGPGTVTLSGANSYGGGTTVEDGTLQLTGAGTLGSLAATTTVNNGELNLGATTQQQANVILQGGLIGNGTLNATTGFLQNGGTFSGITTTPIYAQTGGIMSGTANADTYAQSNGNMSGTANAGTYGQSGGTMSGTANADAYAQSDGDMSGTANAAAYNQSGGTLSGSANVNVFSMTGGTVLTSGTVTATTTFDMQAGTVEGVLAGAGTLIKSTDGLVVLTGPNTYTGPTSIVGGTLLIGGGAAIIDQGVVDVAQGGTLELVSDEVIGLLSGAGTVNVNDRSLLTGGLGDSTFSGLVDGTGGLIKVGSSTFTLDNATVSNLTLAEGSVNLLNGFVGGLAILGGPGALASGSPRAALLTGEPVLNVRGTPVVGTLVTSGTVDYRDGATDDTLFVGNYAGGGTMAVDLDIGQFNATAQLADQLAIAAAASGSTAVVFNVISTRSVVLAKEIVIVDGGGAADFQGGEIKDNSLLINYSFVRNAAGQWVVRSNLDATQAGSSFGAIPSTLTTIQTVLTQPTGSFTAPTSANIQDERSLGIWTRMHAGTLNQSFDGTALNPGGSGSFAFASDTDYAMVQAGADFALEDINGSGATVFFGVTGGLLDGRQTANDVAGAQVEFSVPFIGGYVALEKGPFDLEAGVRFADYDFEVADPFLGSADLDGTGVSVYGNASYELKVAGISVVPNAGLSWIRSDVDSFVAPGTGTLVFEDHEALLGHVGLGLSKTFELDERPVTLSPFLNGAVWHDFTDSFDSALVQEVGGSVPIALDTVGTYGQISVGISGTNLDSNVSGFAKADFLFGQNTQGASVSVGFRKTF